MQHKLWQQQQQRQHLKSCVNHRQSGNILVLYVCPSQSECKSVRVCVYLLVWVRETAEQQNAKRKCRQYPIGNRWKFIENCAQIKFYVCLLFHLRRRHAVISPHLPPILRSPPFLLLRQLSRSFSWLIEMHFLDCRSSKCVFF